MAAMAYGFVGHGRGPWRYGLRPLPYDGFHEGVSYGGFDYEVPMATMTYGLWPTGPMAYGPEAYRPDDLWPHGFCLMKQFP